MDTFDDLRQKAADINGDGVVTIDDATFLQTYLAEFETTFPIGEVAWPSEQSNRIKTNRAESFRPIRLYETMIHSFHAVDDAILYTKRC